MDNKNIISALSDKAHEDFRHEIREFVQDQILPLAKELDERKIFPKNILQEMGNRGWMGIPIPKKYGGAGLDNLSYIIAVEEISTACGSTGITLAAHTSLVVWPIYIHGTGEQKEKYLVPLAQGKHVGSFGLTEPGAGSDAGAIETRAALNNDHYIINGVKRFITNGSYADTFIFTASQDPSLGVYGISAFIVEKDTPGFTISRTEDKLGLLASDTAELQFEDCIIPRENLLGEEYKGFKEFMETLDGGRISIGALALGEAQGALNVAIQYIKENKLNRSQNVQKAIADMKTEISAARHLIYHAARLKDQKYKVTLEGAMAKLYASEVCMRVTSKTMDIIGMDGLTKNYSAERFFRDAKLNEIGEGTSEIQRIIIAREVLKNSSTSI